MTQNIKELADQLNLSAAGDLTLSVSGLAEPQTARHDQLAVAMAPMYADGLAAGQAQVAILWEGADWQALGLKAAIFATRPRVAMAGLTGVMDQGQHLAAGIHPSAVIDPTAELSEGVSIGPMAVVGERAVIGAGTVIGPLAFVGADVVMGNMCFVREHASIGARCVLGDRVILQPGARLGGDGFSYVTAEKSHVETARATMGDPGTGDSQSWMRIASVGAVTLGDDVEIGSNANIDNGTIRDTVIGRGTKVDSLVQVGHNCTIGENCLLCGQSGLAGSVVLGSNVVIGGKASVADNLTIGDNAVIAGNSGVASSVPAGRMVMGYPAVKMETFTEIYKAQRRLPRLLRDFAALRKSVSKDEPKG
jgi:UDP-3-O-[3-hydroxymyristoyl] glucosamine N-acyltransferase